MRNTGVFILSKSNQKVSIRNIITSRTRSRENMSNIIGDCKVETGITDDGGTIEVHFI